MKTYLDIIEDTVEYYFTHNRGLYDIYRALSGCVYINDKGDMCAIGRYAKDPQALENIGGDLSQICDHFLNLDNDDDLDLNLYIKECKNLLKEKILKEEVSHLNSYYFWKTLQQFHDNTNNWIRNDKDGWSLTEDGQQHYINLLKTDWD